MENEGKVLRLTLKKKWFDMYASGIKKEEYREVKDYWVKRLCVKHPQSVISGGDLIDRHKGTNYSFKKFDKVLFKHGYSKNAPTLLFKCNGIRIGKANPEWSDNIKGDVFVIEIGEMINSTPGKQ